HDGGLGRRRRRTGPSGAASHLVPARSRVMDKYAHLDNPEQKAFHARADTHVDLIRAELATMPDTAEPGKRPTRPGKGLGSPRIPVYEPDEQLEVQVDDGYTAMA